LGNEVDTFHNYWLNLRDITSDLIPKKLIINNEKIIENEFGNILHGMKNNSVGYNTFGEAYFSLIKKGCMKGWKCHKKMTLNLIVPNGEVIFFIYKNNPRNKSQKGYYIKISEKLYSRFTVPPGFWVSFLGVSEEKNIILNIADLVHDPSESFSETIDTSFMRLINKIFIS